MVKALFCVITIIMLAGCATSAPSMKRNHELERIPL